MYKRQVFELLSDSHGVDLYDDIENQIYPMATLFIGDELVHVGRVRKDLDNDHGLSMWIVSDQLMKGAAYNLSLIHISKKRNGSVFIN